MTELSVLIPSCDAYSDLWAPFFNLFFRFWPDCPFPVLLGSNTQTFYHDRIHILYSSRGKNWTNSTREFVEALTTPYVLLFLEDFFLRRPVPTAAVLSAFESLKHLNGDMLRLMPRPGPDIGLAQYPNVGRIEVGAPWRVSTQVAIWKRQTLLDLMREGEPIWEFEFRGSRRSDALGDTFYAVWQPLIPYGHHVVQRGKWFPHAAWRFGRMNIGCVFSCRPVMNWREAAQWYLGKIAFYPFHKLPWKWQYKIEDVARLVLRRKKRIQ